MQQKQFRKGLKLLLISGLLLLVSGVGWLVIGLLISAKKHSIPVSVVVATEDTVEDKITGESGVIKLDNQRYIKSLGAGTVEEILVKPGDQVKQGQVLIRLRDQEIKLKFQELQTKLQDTYLQISNKRIILQRSETKLLEAQQEYQANQNKIATAINKLKQDQLWAIQKQELQINKQQKDIERLINDLNKKKVTLEEDRQLFERGFIAETEVQNDRDDLTQTEINLSNAKNELQLSNIELQKQKLELSSLEQDIAQGLSEPQQKLKQSKTQVEQIQQEINEAKLALNQAIREQQQQQIEGKKITEELRKTTIISPSNSIILSIKVKIGDVINDQNDVILIGDSSKQIVEFKLNPLDVTKVKIKQKAEMSLVGVESEKLTGQVQEISLIAGEDQDNNSYDSQGVKVAAIIRLDPSKQKLVTGTPVTVDIILAKKENAIVLPSELIQNDEKATYVWVKNSQNKATKKVITIGLQGLETTEIKSGLKSGDEVLNPPPDTGLNEGDLVKIQKN